LRNDSEIIAILEDSVWTQARVVGLAEDLLLRIDELRTMLAETDLD
jgi:DNA repair protein RadC